MTNVNMFQEVFDKAIVEVPSEIMKFFMYSAEQQKEFYDKYMQELLKFLEDSKKEELSDQAKEKIALLDGAVEKLRSAASSVEPMTRSAMMEMAEEAVGFAAAGACIYLVAAAQGGVITVEEAVVVGWVCYEIGKDIAGHIADNVDKNVEQMIPGPRLRKDTLNREALFSLVSPGFKAVA